MTWRLARFLLATVLLGMPTALSADRPADGVLETLNAARGARGLVPARERAQLSAAARTHLADMAARGYFDAEPPGSAAFQDWLEQSGFVPGLINIVVSAGYPDGALLVGSLLETPAYRDILLHPHAGEVGIGHRSTAYRAGRDYVTDAWVLVLARTAYDPVPAATDGLIRAINRSRLARGLPAVRPARELSATAMAHARDMVARGFFAHRSPEGRDVGDRARGHGYRYRKVGENLAAGDTTPDGVVRGWTDSPGHAAVMFDPDFREVGVGYLPGPVEEPTRNLGQIWVAVFGTRQ